MQFYRCKCGKSTSWTTMGVYRCSRCKYCGSDLAQGPESHREPEPHKYETMYNEHTGAPYERCMTCYRTREKLEKPPEPDAPEPPPDPEPGYPKLDQFPHCDDRVLHRPENCEHCALPKFAVLHEYRAAKGINYTGESEPGKRACPAELLRSRATIEKWGGNRPSYRPSKS